MPKPKRRKFAIEIPRNVYTKHNDYKYTWTISIKYLKASIQ